MDFLTNLLITVSLEVCGANCVVYDVSKLEPTATATLSQVVEQVVIVHCNNEDTPYESL